MPTKEKIVETTTKEHLKYVFSEEELKDLSMEMAQATIQGNEAEEQKKAAMAGYKDTIERHLLTSRTASRLITNGCEMKYIECSKVINYTQGTVTITRKDTGEVVEERGLRDSERQMSMD